MRRIARGLWRERADVAAPGPAEPVPIVSTIPLGRLRLARVNQELARRWILAQAKARIPSVVVTSNIYHLKLAETDGEFRRVVAQSELNVADGWPVTLAARLLRRPVGGRIAGVDLVAAVLASGERLRVAILGGPPGAARELAARISDVHEVALVDELARGSWDTAAGRAALATRMADARPELTLVGIGPPKQELLADSLRGEARGPIICCGATIAFLAGRQRRAPVALQRLGLEWAFRLVLEPRRLASRYLTSGVWFLLVVGREVLAAAAGARGRPARS
jgi:N-acetylglucosaminyldiphosphoundecaprenol N-acetyl-beta-D-mannosaminyltransferase